MDGSFWQVRECRSKIVFFTTPLKWIFVFIAGFFVLGGPEFIPIDASNRDVVGSFQAITVIIGAIMIIVGFVQMVRKRYTREEYDRLNDKRRK